LKTRQPLILTARVAEKDLEPFDRLRQAHFPPERNLLRAHLTMFHRLPGEYVGRIVEKLEQVAGRSEVITVEVSGLRHLGAGVAYTITSKVLQEIRATRKAEFVSWLGSQDMQAWQPHITVQNNAPKPKADNLYRNLSQGFRSHPIDTTGLDLWEYLGGPWRHAKLVSFNGVEP
jgi:hypothetical protein